MSDTAKWTVAVTSSAIAEEALELLHARNCRVKFCDFTGNKSSSELAEFLCRERPHAIILRQGRIGRDELTASDRLRVVSKHGVGVDTIDIAAATDLAVVVMNTPGANSESVAEHTLALTLALSRQVPLQDRKTRSGLWDKKDYRARDLAGRTFGIVGFGRIGRRVAQLVAPLEMKVIVYDPAFPPADIGDVQFTGTLAELLTAADVVSLHCGLCDETRGMFGLDEFRLMGSNALFINTARGAVAQESALVEALRTGLIAGAALDTFESEPPSDDCPLFVMDNVILTNHIAGISEDSMRNMGVTAAQNILAVLEGSHVEMANVLNGDVLDGGALS